MIRTLALLFVLVLVVGSSWADVAAPPTLSSGPPTMGTAQLLGDILIVGRGVLASVPQVLEKTRNVDGRTESYKYSTYRIVTVPNEEAIAANDYRIFDTLGKPVDPITLAKRLQDSTPVLISEEGRKVDPQFLALYKPDTLIIYLRSGRPHASGHSGQAPMPAPVPAGQPA